MATSESIEALIATSSKRTTGKIIKQPVLRRDRTYCYMSFIHRLADWLTLELKSVAIAAVQEKAQQAKQTPPPPTRVQPSRAAKRKVDEATAAVSAVKKEGRDYILGLGRCTKLFGDGGQPTEDGLENVVQQVATAIEDKVAELQQGEKGVRSLRRCAVVDMLPGCNDGVYCLHRLMVERPGRKRKRRGGKEAGAVPEAEMVASPTLGRWRTGNIVEPPEDIGRCTVEVEDLGLRFAVDICAGFVKIAML